MSELAAHLVDRVLPSVPIRQWVFTVPVRYQLAFDAELTRAALRVFLRTVFGWQRRWAAHRGLVGRGVAVSRSSSTLLAAPLVTEAQQVRKAARIGYLSAHSESRTSLLHKSVREGLRELGYLEGRNIIVDYRWADGDYERVPSLARGGGGEPPVGLIATTPPVSLDQSGVPSPGSRSGRRV